MERERGQGAPQARKFWLKSTSESKFCFGFAGGSLRSRVVCIDRVVMKNTEGAIAHGEEGFCPLSPSHLVEIDRCVVAAAAAESGADGRHKGGREVRLAAAGARVLRECDVDGVLLVELLLKLVQQPVAHVGDLQAYIPKIESCEDGKQIIELRDQYVGVSFDLGTTRAPASARPSAPPCGDG